MVDSLHREPPSEVFHASCRTKQDKCIAKTASNGKRKRDGSISRKKWVTDGIIPDVASRIGAPRLRPSARNCAGALVVEPCGFSFHRKKWVTDGTRTRNSQNHNLELYH